MPLTLNGYHVFQLRCAVKDAESSIHFSELENDLGDGYHSQVLFGSETGNRSWKLTLPTLDHGSRTATSINGETLTYEEYLWDLFEETKVTGRPFAFQDPRTSQYYLVRFADKALSYNRLFSHLYSSGIELRQVRIFGESVFQPQDISQTFAAWDGNSGLEPTGGGDIWEPEAPSIAPPEAFMFEASGDVINATSGSRGILRFSSTANDGVLTTDTPGTYNFYDIFLLMKMREATFSNNAGIFTSDVTGLDPPLIGSTGTTKFFNVGHADYTYKLNGITHAQGDQQAPMNEWGIVHLRFADGIPVVNPQLGKDRDFAGRFAEMDLGYFILSSSLFPQSTVRQIMEHLAIIKAEL